MSQPGAAFVLRRRVALAVVCQRLRAEDRSPRQPVPRQPRRTSPERTAAPRSAGIFTAAAIDHAFWSVSVQSLKHGGTLYRLNAIADADPGVEAEADHERGRRRSPRLGLSLHHEDLRDRSAVDRRRSRRRSGHRLERRSDDQPASSGSLGRVRRVGQAAVREGHPARRRAADRRRQRVCRAGLGLRLGVGRSRASATARRSARCNTTRTRSSC